MQIIRTAIWVLLLVALLLFSIANWDPTVTVRIWDGIVVDTKIPAIVIVSFLIGFVPMWLYHRGSKWKTSRKIASLENAARLAAATPVANSTATTDTTPATPPQPAEPDTPLQPTYSDATLAQPPSTADGDKGPHTA
ncbi:MAG: LapA family protein [Erythrobacter sp.]|nr:MAG: LapA family protein [Erythrobacter sp.]